MKTTDEALFKILLALSDQQLFTGVAILTLAYIQMESVTAYHAAIIECMAELAFVVTDATSTVMVSHLRKPENFFMMTWRGVFILSFMALLLIMQIPLGNEYWLTSFGMPFICFWREFKGHYDIHEDPNLVSMLMAMFWMAIGIRETVCNYFPAALDPILNHVVFRYMNSGFVKMAFLPRRLSSYSFKKSRQGSSPKAVRVACKICGAIAFFFALLVFVVAELSTSVALGLQGNWFMLLGSVSWSFFLRSYATSNGRIGDEDKWGFGQAVPVFLLGLPFFALAEALYGKSASTSHNASVIFVVILHAYTDCTQMLIA
jgi:hypothetical protein